MVLYLEHIRSDCRSIWHSSVFYILGLVCTGPLITLWILNKSFGKLYDANSDSDTGICYLGNGCYQGAFELSLVLCGMTFVVTLLLIYIQRKQ